MAQDTARRLSEGGRLLDNEGVDAPARLALAWALKTECYAAWSSDPPRATQAARALRSLQSPGTAADGAIEALADWTDGIACLVSSRMDAAVEAFDAASRRWCSLGEPLHAAHAQVPKIMALTVLGRFDDAQACARDTETALLRAGDTHGAAKVRLNLGSLAYSRDEHARAMEHYRAAAVRFARVGDHEHSVMADIGIADALSSLGRLADASMHYARAQARAHTHALPVLAAMGQHGIALLALSQGRYREALKGLEASRRDFSALGLAHRLTEAEKSLADAYLELRLLPEAIDLYGDLATSLRAEGALATLPWVLAQLARAQALAGKPGVALVTLEQAAGGFVAQDNAAGRATVHAVASQVHAAAGQPRDALLRARQARAAFASARLPAHEAAARVQAVACLVASGEHTAALIECEALLADGRLPPQVRLRARIERAAALLALARSDEARAALEEAIEGVEVLRAGLPGEDLRRAFLADAAQPYVQRLQVALDDAPSHPDGAADVLRWLERYKARALQERLGPGDTTPWQAAASGPARERLDWIYRRQQRLVEDAGQPPQALRDEASRLERRLLEDARRERLSPPPDAPSTGAAQTPPRLDVRALQQMLGPGRALVEYGVVGDELIAIVVRADRVRLHRALASWPLVTQAVQQLRFQLDALRAGGALASRHGDALLERAQRRLSQLHAFVWAPLAHDVGGCSQLLVVPHGVLHGVPFAALQGPDGALIDRHELVMAASAGVAWQGLRGAPLAEPGARWRRAVLVGSNARLAHVPQELQAVQAALDGPVVQQLSEARAGVAAVCAAAVHADLLHLACHARFRADNPLFSALDLADGALTADQIQGMRLQADLVVLSACESALGQAGAGDEGVGLVRALLLAGARRVLGSLWAVDDACTAAFMAHFYRAASDGRPIAAALRQAQCAVRVEWPHPAHWAAFALHGAA